MNISITQCYETATEKNDCHLYFSGGNRERCLLLLTNLAQEIFVLELSELKAFYMHVIFEAILFNQSYALRLLTKLCHVYWRKCKTANKYLKSYTEAVKESQI